MKKVLALTLSAVLAMGAATTAFAATQMTINGQNYTSGNTNYSFLQLGPHDDEVGNFTFADGSTTKMKWGKEYTFQITLDSSKTTNIATVVDKDDDDIYGAYDFEGVVGVADINTKYDLEIDTDKYTMGDAVNTTEELFDLVDANKASLKVKITDGKEYIETAKINDAGDEMYLDITTVDSLSTKDGEVAFELTLSAKGASEFKDRTLEIKKQKIGLTTASAETDVTDSMEVDAQGEILDTEDMEACEDYEIIWGDNELARFVVDLDDNDGKKNLSYTTAPVDALIEANPTANMDFFTLKAAPRFNKIGEMTIYADGDVFKYIYEIDADGQLSEVNATYDEDEEGFVFNTRTLGSYVVSDIELVGAAIDEEVPGESDTEVPGESDTTTDDGRENPATGANDMVNVAAAMAVVSLAAAGAVAFKKSSK